MKVAFISDMHGKLDFSVDPCELLAICGDICPCGWDSRMSCLDQEIWLRDVFIPWFNEQPVQECVAIAGNHDWIWDIGRSLVPPMPDNFHYLCDEKIELLGLRIYGTPQQKYFNNWAFNRSPEQLQKYFSEIPEGLDILITHTPPFKILDKVDFPNFKGHEGCKVLKTRIVQMHREGRPKINAFGHMHGQYGVVQPDYMGGTKFINCSLVDEHYDRNKLPIYLEV